MVNDTLPGSAERAVRSLLMQLPEGLLSIDAAGCIAFANVEAQRMLGIDGAALLGRPLGEVLPTVTFERPSRAATEPVLLPDLVVGDRVFAPAIRRYAGVDATETMLSFRDVTSDRSVEQRRAELLAAERRARAQAEEASRAKDDFLAVVSHELRTPLNAILGWTRMLRGGALDPAKAERALEIIERNARSQQKLIEDILDVSRIVSGKLQLQTSPVDLEVTARTALEALRPAADTKGITLSVKAGDRSTIVVGDPDRLQQVVWNLLSNAVKFTPRGGAIFLEVGVEGASAFIRLRDTGQGMSPELLPHVFERFRQGETGTTRAHGGLGLGLSIVRNLVERHGGTVTASSEGKGRGTTFLVHLPVADSPIERRIPGSLPAVRATDHAGPEDSLDGLRILVVDDDGDARDLLVAVFEQLAAKVHAVASVPEALAAIDAFHPQVVVSDIGMPDEDGYQLAERLRRLPPTNGGPIPAVALTAFAAPSDRARALAAGFSAYVTKPVDARVLARLMSDLTGQRARKQDP